MPDKQRISAEQASALRRLSEGVIDGPLRSMLSGEALHGDERDDANNIDEYAGAADRVIERLTGDRKDLFDECVALKRTLAATSAALAGRVWLVWSTEHQLFWRANKCGYTPSLFEAGRYSLAEALACCNTRSFEGQACPELPVPAPEWLHSEALAGGDAVGGRG